MLLSWFELMQHVIGQYMLYTSAAMPSLYQQTVLSQIKMCLKNNHILEQHQYPVCCHTALSMDLQALQRDNTMM